MARYEVPGMKLIPQQKGMSCWYASARMIIHWQMNRCGQCFEDLVPPELDAACGRIRDADNGIGNPAILRMATRLGLKQQPQIFPSSTTSGDIKALLQFHGPLWVNGDRHIVVIGGIDGDQIKVYDPWPPGKGKVEWRSLSAWLFRDKSSTYIVRPGDSMSKIGQAHGVDWKDIYTHANNAMFRLKRSNPDLIEPGDRIFIPTSASDMDSSAAISFLYLPSRACAI